MPDYGVTTIVPVEYYYIVTDAESAEEAAQLVLDGLIDYIDRVPVGADELVDITELD